MRGWLGLFVLGFALNGCAISKERRALGYSDYHTMSCDQLGHETVRLVREATDRSQHIIENDQDRRDRANLQLKGVKQARAEKGC